MAKFFKNYNIINLKIFNEVESQVDKKSLNDFNIQPKYLAMLYLKHCDFCCNNDNEDTFINNLNFFYGYQICSKCDENKNYKRAKELGTPSKNKNVIFSDIVQKGRRGSGSNHYFWAFKNSDILGRWEGDKESVSLFL